MLRCSRVCKKIAIVFFAVQQVKNAKYTASMGVSPHGLCVNLYLGRHQSDRNGGDGGRTKRGAGDYILNSNFNRYTPDIVSENKIR